MRPFVVFISISLKKPKPKRKTYSLFYLKQMARHHFDASRRTRFFALHNDNVHMRSLMRMDDTRHEPPLSCS